MRHEQKGRLKKLWHRSRPVYLIVLTTGLSLAGLATVGNAVDPGWSTGDDISQSTSSYDDGDISAPIVNDNNNNNQDSNQDSGAVSVPVIGGGKAGSLGESTNSDQDSHSNSGSMGSETVNNDINSGSTSPQSNDNSTTSSSSSSVTKKDDNNDNDNHVQIHEHHESKAALRKFARQQFYQAKKRLQQQNAQRTATNNAKGARQLRAAYRLRLKAIRSGKIDQQTRNQYVDQQKSALQQALSQRLATLQADYDKGQQQIRHEVAALPSNHQSDKQAMQLDGALANLDYQLGRQSNRAYTRYNRSVNELLAQTAKVKHSERSRQYGKAKQEYQNNLRAVDALDPGQLQRANRQRKRQLKAVYQDVQAQIESGEITKKVQIVDKFSW